MTVRVYKLISGEDIIGTFVSETELAVTLDNPAALVIQQGPDRNMSAGLAPYAPFAKDNRLTLYKNSLGGEFEIDVQLENEYSRIFSTGIQIASAGSLIK